MDQYNILKYVHISGQVGVDQTNKPAGDGSLLTQTRQALSNLKMVLTRVGVRVGDAVELIIYVVVCQYEHAGIILEELRAVSPAG